MANLEKHQPHFIFDANGKSYVYCYIRKNACSSWKRFISRESPYSERLTEFLTPMSFMGEYHKVRSIKKLQKAEHAIVILRDPIDRVVSGFLNQFVKRLGKPTVMHDLVQRTLDKPAQKVTFEEFVYNYICSSKELDLDVHFIPQYLHMNDSIGYDKVWLIDHLFEEASSEFGETIANKYFYSKINSLNHVASEKNWSYVKAEDVYESFCRLGKFPEKCKFLDKGLQKMLEEFYFQDLEILKKRL